MSYSMEKRKFGNSGLGDTERGTKLLLNSRRQRYGSANITNNAGEDQNIKFLLNRRCFCLWSKKNCIWYTGNIYIMPTYGCKNNAYSLVVQTINSEHSTTIIPPLRRKTGSVWHNHYTWCINVTIYERRVVVVTPIHRL
jgi:hypothetical protein